MPEHILLFEPNNRGYHPAWLRYLTHDLLAAGKKITLAIDLRNEELIEQLQEESPGYFDNVRRIDVCDKGGDLKGGGLLSSLKSCFIDSGAESIFVASLDELLSHVLRKAVFGIRPSSLLKGRISGVYHHPRPLDPSQFSLAQYWKRLGLRRLVQEGWFKSIFLIDEFLPGVAQSLVPGAQYPFLPDPWDGHFPQDKNLAREILGIRTQRPILLHYGQGAYRKGLHLLMKAIELIPQPKRPFLLVAGRLQKDVPLLTELKWFERQGQALLLNRYISNKEEALCFAATDLVALPYINHYGSVNVLSRAAAAKRPVIASDFHLLGKRVATFKLGYCFRNDSLSSLIQSIEQAILEGPIKWERFSEGLEAYAAKTSRLSFTQALSDGLA